MQKERVEKNKGGRTHAQNTVQNRPTRNSTLELLNLATRLVDVKRPNDNHPRRTRKVSDGDGDLGAEVLGDGVDVVLELGRDGDDRSLLGDRGCISVSPERTGFLSASTTQEKEEGGGKKGWD